MTGPGSTPEAGALADAAGGAGADGGSAGGGGSGSGGGSGGDGGTCQVITLGANLSMPDMLIVLDRSGSMNPGDDSPTDRWSGSRDALVEVTQQFDDGIRFGLMTFPEYSPGGNADRCAPGTVNVPIGSGTGPIIATTLSAMDADGRTPTAPSLTNALAVLGSVETSPDARPTPKYVLLVTDGDPNCSNGNGGGGGGIDQAARTATIQAIEALAAQGIKTFVVGFETAGTEFAQQLDAMAAAGDTGATAHQSVDSGADLQLVLSDLVGRVASCSYSLNAPVENASYVAVSVGGTPRRLDDRSDGWTLGADAQTVTLTGAACDAVKAGAELNIEVRCTIVVLN